MKISQILNENKFKNPIYETHMFKMWTVNSSGNLIVWVGQHHPQQGESDCSWLATFLQGTLETTESPNWTKT